MADIGAIRSSGGGTLQVTNCQIYGGYILHTGREGGEGPSQFLSDDFIPRLASFGAPAP